MTIEAIEEGNLGVYSSHVLLPTNGSLSLVNFILTDNNPTGTKALAISLFSCVRSFCETLKSDKEEKYLKLGEIIDATKGQPNGTTWTLLVTFNELYNATKKGLHEVISLGLCLLFSPDCQRTTNPDAWSRPNEHSISWMKLDMLFKTIPSKTIIPEFKTDARLSSCPIMFKKLNELALDIKETLGTKKYKYGHYEFLVKSVDKVIHSVNRYIKESEPQPFDRERLKFHPSVKWKPFKEDAGDSIWTSYENASKLSDYDDSASIPPSSSKWNEIWCNIKEEFTKDTPKHQDFEPYEVEQHPIVRVIGGFAVAAFNEACEMHVKKGEHNNLHDFEFLECKYEKVSNGFLFYMTIEAIEEGNLGVYMTHVLCPNDGSLSLVNFILTDYNPTGTKALAISLFCCVRFFCETLKRDKEEKYLKLGEIIDATKGRPNGTAWALMRTFKELYNATKKGLHEVISLGLRLLFSPDCKRTTNPDAWSRPDKHPISWLVCRNRGAPCRGYDYDSPLLQTGTTPCNSAHPT